jgi:predicted dithiol-disulfide oxidoreductase (DUF899 family)
VAALKPCSERKRQAKRDGCQLAPHKGETDDPVDAGESPGVSAFVLEDGQVFHTDSTYARGPTCCQLRPGLV